MNRLEKEHLEMLHLLKGLQSTFHNGVDCDDLKTIAYKIDKFLMGVTKVIVKDDEVGIEESRVDCALLETLDKLVTYACNSNCSSFTVTPSTMIDKVLDAIIKKYGSSKD